MRRKHTLTNWKLAMILVIPFLWRPAHAQQSAGKVPPLKQGKYYRIHLLDQVLEVDPSIGGRITSLKIHGEDFLTDSTVNNFNWGSTLWPSPQSEWKWPPSSELDNKPYSIAVEQNEIVMRSQKDPKTGLVFTKSISGDKQTRSFLMKYTITNSSNAPQKVAPWEVTRVKTHGIAFFPFGQGDRRGGLIPFTTEKDGISWFHYRDGQLPTQGDRQLYSDGAEGWLAQINNDVILVKKFVDVPFEDNAPNEGEVEWYASPVKPGKSYVEIEHQGHYKELAPGASLTWEVTWILRQLPKNIKAEVGNASLVAYVRKLVK